MPVLPPNNCRSQLRQSLLGAADAHATGSTNTPPCLSCRPKRWCCATPSSCSSPSFESTVLGNSRRSARSFKRCVEMLFDRPTETRCDIDGQGDPPPIRTARYSCPTDIRARMLCKLVRPIMTFPAVSCWPSNGPIGGTVRELAGRCGLRCAGCGLKCAGCARVFVVHGDVRSDGPSVGNGNRVRSKHWRAGNCHAPRPGAGPQHAPEATSAAPSAAKLSAFEIDNAKTSAHEVPM